MAVRWRCSVYYLFAGDDYYPSGGALDFIDKFATIHEAKLAHVGTLSAYGHWAHIANEDMRIVSEWMRGDEWRDRTEV
jgi:hypothetical protein